MMIALPFTLFTLRARRRAMTALLLATVLATAPVAVPPDRSDIPNPDYCSVVPCDQMFGILTAPHTGNGPEATRFVVTVMYDAETPIPNAFVEIIVEQPGDHHFCPGARLTGITDAQGQVTFNLAMGGCTLADHAVWIRANNVDIRIYQRLLSPDYDGQADGMVVLSDFTVFGAAFVAGTGGCTDYYHDGTTGIDDFTGFAACWARSCSR
jgi:hypothetical protein